MTDVDEFIATMDAMLERLDLPSPVMFEIVLPEPYRQRAKNDFHVDAGC